MIGSTRSVRVWARNVPTDLRMGFDGLFGLVEQEIRLDPLSGDCFLFVNRNRTSAKVLVWDGTGLCIYAKRLASGRFAALWGQPGEPALQMTTTELALFLEGADLKGRLPLSPSQYSVGQTCAQREAG
jgi:transposase